MIVLNLRGVRESVLVLTPIFILFVVTHLVLIVGGFIAHAGSLPTTLSAAGSGFHASMSSCERLLNAIASSSLSGCVSRTAIASSAKASASAR